MSLNRKSPAGFFYLSSIVLIRILLRKILIRTSIRNCRRQFLIDMFFSYTIIKKGRRPFFIIYKRKTSFWNRFEGGVSIRFQWELSRKCVTFTTHRNGQRVRPLFGGFDPQKDNIIFDVSSIQIVLESCHFYVYFSPF